ncbi:MAG: aldehyde dehydrogenase family protein [Planctomycetes bacterium]|nr:aldehyde dehydrogenase family protein [Planctomycetota bacterium]
MHTGSYIDGAWYQPKNDRLIRNFNPANSSEVIAEYPAATAECVARAVAGASEAFKTWSKVPAPERARVIWRATEIARGRVEEFGRTLTTEEGKILAEGCGEIKKGISVLEYYAGAGTRLAGRTLPAEGRDVFTYTLRRPLGVVGLITPWNFPWAIPVWKVAPALVAGNTCVLKPSEITPNTAAHMVEIFEEAGLPKGCLQMVVGYGDDVGQAIVDHPDVKAISFTGSTATGHKVYAAAASRGAKVTCELGGKNAVIALADADVDAVVASVMNGAFGSTGQRCTATSRLLVHESIVGQVTEALVAGAQALKIGPGLSEGIQMGPIVDEQQFTSVLSYLEIGKSEADCLTGGGKVEELSEGYFVQPTVFGGVAPDARIFQEEIFGPVLSICTIKDLDEGLRYANSVRYGLTSSVYTQDIYEAMRFVEGIETGMVHVNEPTVGGEAQLPFGGIKDTGVGDKEMSSDGLNFFTEEKTVFINFDRGTKRDFNR